MLPDTLGILNPLQVIEFMRKMKKRYPYTHFDFHAHNDYCLLYTSENPLNLILQVPVPQTDTRSRDEYSKALE